MNNEESYIVSGYTLDLLEQFVDEVEIELQQESYQAPGYCENSRGRAMELIGVLRGLLMTIKPKTEDPVYWELGASQRFQKNPKQEVEDLGFNWNKAIEEIEKSIKEEANLLSVEYADKSS